MKIRCFLLNLCDTALHGCTVITVPVGLQCPVAPELMEQCADTNVQAEHEFEEAVKEIEAKIDANPDTDLSTDVLSLAKNGFDVQKDYRKRLAICIRVNKALADTIRVCNENAAALRSSMSWGRP